MGRASGRKRERRAARSWDGKAAWARPVHVDEGDPHAVAAALEERLAGLEGLRHAIHHQDRGLHELTQHHHDRHNDEGQRLAEEIRHIGVGADPALEDAYGQHLIERSVAESVGDTLRRRIGDFRPAI